MTVVEKYNNFMKYIPNYCCVKIITYQKSTIVITTLIDKEVLIFQLQFNFFIVIVEIYLKLKTVFFIYCCFFLQLFVIVHGHR